MTRARLLAATRRALDYTADLALHWLDRVDAAHDAALATAATAAATAAIPTLEVGTRLTYDGRHWQVTASEQTDDALALICWPASPLLVLGQP